MQRREQLEGLMREFEMGCEQRSPAAQLAAVSRHCAFGCGWIPPGSNQAFIVPLAEKAMGVGHERS